MNRSRFQIAFQIIGIALFVQLVIVRTWNSGALGIYKRQGHKQLLVIRSTANTNTTNSDSDSYDPKQLAYQTALKRFQERRLRYQFRDLAEQYPGKERVINSLRIPKAGSSHLSVIARALAGCHPDGFPCCGAKDKNCPRTDLMCEHLVIGCVNHIPNFHGLIDRRRKTERNISNVPMIGSFRYPTERILSAYFYGQPHSIIPRNQNHTWEMFESQVASPFHRNTMVKMLTIERIPYGVEFDPVLQTVQAAKNRVCESLEWYHMNDLPLLSALLLYEREAFRALIPNPVVFGLPADNSTGLQPPSQSQEIAQKARKARQAKSGEKKTGLRVNENPQYETFKSQTYVENNGDDLVKQYNQADVELYEFVLDLFCAQCIEVGLLDLARSFIPQEVAVCDERMDLQSVDDYCPSNANPIIITPF